MKKKNFMLTALLISSRLFAQNDSSIQLLDEVVVTANKYANKTSLTGKVITVITRQQLERSGGKDLAQVLSEQAGLSINGANSNFGKDKSVYLRGANTAYTLITIDGVPVYDPSGIGANFDIRNFSISNIERIEILKGSQSTLYGSDALAGVINIITKKVSGKSFAGNSSLSYGTNNSINGAIGIDGKNEKINYSIAYNQFTTDGFNETISSSANADKDGYAQKNISVSFGTDKSKNWNIQPYFRFAKLKGDIDQGAFTDELDYTFDQQSLQSGLSSTFLIGKTKFNLLYNYNSISREYIDDSTKSRNGYDTYSKGTYSGAEHFVDFYTHFQLNSNLKLTGGVDFRKSNSDQSYFSLGFFGPYNTNYSKDKLKQQQLGLYAALNLSTAKNFSLEVGNRINLHSEYGSNYVFNFNPSLLINQQLKLFANLSSAYRTPSLYQLFSAYGNKNLKPETAITFESGLHYFTNNNNFSGKLVAFKRNVKDVIFFYYNPLTWESQYINQDKQNDFGAEVEFSVAVSKQNSVKAFYTFVDGEITSKIANNRDTTYNNLLRRPKNSFGISTESQLGKQFYISNSLHFFGKRKDAYFDNQTYSTVNVTLKNYVLWNIYLEYSLPKTKLKFFTTLKNITNSKYTEVSGFATSAFQATGGLRLNF